MLLKPTDHMLRASSPRKITPRKLTRPDLGVVEACAAKISGEESTQRLPKSSKVTIHGPRGVFLSSRGAAESSQRAYEELLGRHNGARTDPAELPKDTEYMRSTGGVAAE